MQIKLTGSKEEKLGRHQGLYTKSYQEVRAIYDAKIRNWEIEFKDNLFYIKNSDNIIETVYLERSIANCSCSSFIETECGTCAHIEAVNLIPGYDLPYFKIRPLLFLDRNFKIQKIGSGENIFETPAIKTYNQIKELRKPPFNPLIIEDYEVFKDKGITLFDFQKKSIELMIKNKRTILVLRMGLGKTICALASTKILNKNKIIIVAPNSLKYQWAKEITRFNLGNYLIASKAGDLSYYKEQKFLILSYELLNRNKQLLENNYDIVITDEIQKIKNRESATWKTVSKLKSEYVFALSGTPIQNNINDLISLIEFINPFELKPEWKFYETYCNFTRARIFGILPGKTEALKNKLSRYIINPTIDYSKFKLPSKNQTDTKTNLNAKQLEIHDGNFEQAKILIAKSMNYPLTFGEKLALNQMLTKARIAATDIRLIDPLGDKSEKFQKVEEKLEELTKSKKVIVYSEWIKSLKLLCPFLEVKGIKYVMFNGELNAKKRDQALNAFIEENDIKVFLSTDTGGLGIDGLQFVCNDMIHLEKIWNPMKIEQRNGRLIRALQKENVVNVYCFETNSGIEEMIAINNGRKYQIINDILK